MSNQNNNVELYNRIENLTKLLGIIKKSQEQSTKEINSELREIKSQFYDIKTTLENENKIFPGYIKANKNFYGKRNNFYPNKKIIMKNNTQYNRINVNNSEDINLNRNLSKNNNIFQNSYNKKEEYNFNKNQNDNNDNINNLESLAENYKEGNNDNNEREDYISDENIKKKKKKLLQIQIDAKIKNYKNIKKNEFIKSNIKKIEKETIDDFSNKQIKQIKGKSKSSLILIKEDIKDKFENKDNKSKEEKSLIYNNDIKIFDYSSNINLVKPTIKSKSNNGFLKDNLYVKKKIYADTFILQIEEKIFEQIDIFEEKIKQLKMFEEFFNDIGFVLTKISSQKLLMIIHDILSGIPVLLLGSPCTSKTMLALAASEYITKIINEDYEKDESILIFVLNEETEIDDLLIKYFGSNNFIEGFFFKAFTEGYIILLEGINLAKKRSSGMHSTST